ncbi:MAG TPA: oligosaccharide flippase family protein [Candidatus Acidoferrales bacterium]
MSEVPAVLSSPEASPRHEPDMLPRVLRHSAWLFSSSVIARGVNFLRTLILARLLLPEDFGLFGLASSILGFSLVFGGVGIGPSLLYQRESGRAYRDTAFWLNAALAAAMLGMLCLLAPALAAFYARPGLAWIIVGLAGAFLLQMLGMVHRNFLRRELHFGVLAAAEIAASVAAIVAAVVLALRGHGVWAFVGSLTAANLTSFVMMWRLSTWTPRFSLDRGAVREIARFSSWYLGAALAFYFALSLDRFLIGKFLGLSLLGHYVLAYDFSLALIGLLVSPLSQVIVPALARLRDDPTRFWNEYFRVARLSAALMTPLAFLAVVVAPVALPLAFGPKWTMAVLPFQILIVYLLLRSLAGDPFAAWGRFDLSCKVGLGVLVAGLAGILFALNYGIVGVALAASVVSLSGQLAGVVVTGSIRELARLAAAVTPSILRAGAATAVGWLMMAGMESQGAGRLSAAVAGAAVLGTVYVVLARRDLGEMLDGWRRGSMPSEEARV